MLTRYNRSQFLEKTITDSYGREFRAVFFVTLENGEVKGRIVSLRPVTQTLALPGGIASGFCLPCDHSHCATKTPYVMHVAPFESPYFDIELILNSQPTRAPSNR